MIMQTIPVQTPGSETNRRWALWQLGFRPFFLLAGIAAVGLLATWLLLWQTPAPALRYYGASGWHAHEMLFGYVAAVIAGFLLTSVRNWTGIDTPRGPLLAALAGLWLLGRIVVFFPALPGWLIAVTDLVFLPAIAIALARPLLQARNPANRVFLLILAAMTLANLAIHAQANDLADIAGRGQTFMLNITLLLVLIISGRIMPFFTERAVPGSTATRTRWIERSTFGLMLVWVAVQLSGLSGAAIAIPGLLMAALQIMRLHGWHQLQVWRIPVLWVLYSGYIWLIAGFALHGLAALGMYPASGATHAFTVGAIGVFTLGMMSRVALGHTGRTLQTLGTVNLAFILLNLGAVLRVFGPVVWPGQYTLLIILAGTAWIAAFALFLLTYTPFLLHARADGKPG